jgi:predicted DNA-binding transcriptional regulator YafY
VGEFTDETFTAASADLVIHGVDVHPGQATGKLVNAARLAGRVLAALPPELRTRASRITQCFHLDAPGWFVAAEPLPALETLAAGVWESRRVEITYDRGEKVVERAIEPLGLVLKAGIWYLVARTAGQFRTYRVSRTVGVELTTETFKRPDGFDLGRHWAGSIAAYEKDFERVDLVLRVPGERLEDVWSTIGRERANVGPAGPDGTHVVRAAFEWDDEALSAAIRLSPFADVVEPESVRASMESFARAILARRMAAPTEPAPEPVGAGAAG